MTNYKIIKFNCNCKYLYITNSEHRILKAVKRCPRHGTLRKHVEVICESCGKRLIIKGNTSWQRKKRCLECGRLAQNAEVRKNRHKKYKTKANAKSRTGNVNNLAEHAKKTGSLRRLYRKMVVVLPEIPETLMIDILHEKYVLKNMYL